MKRRTYLIALPALAPAAWAHGPAPHGAPPKKEQLDWGIAGEARAVRRTVTLRMSDAMRFTPNHLEVREGETLRLRVHNDGAVMHELVIGTQAALDEHAALMLKFPNMAHDEAHMAHVPPRGVGEIVWTFNRPGDFAFACLIAGHYQAGMTGTIRVLPRKK